MKKKTQFPLYPFLISAYPVVHMYLRNLDITPVAEAVRPLLLLMAVTAIGLMATDAILKDRRKSAVYVSTLMLSLSYGYFAQALLRITAPLSINLRPLLLSQYSWIVWLVLMVIFLVVLKKTPVDLTLLHRFLGAFAVILVAIPVCQTAFGLVHKTGRADRENKWDSVVKADVQAAKRLHSTVGAPPDVYCIILDAYARQDTLRSTFGYDNSEFVDYLTRKGFRVASASQSNYITTDWALPCYLNFDYLDTLDRAIGMPLSPKTNNKIRDNRISRILQSKGYKYVLIASAWGVTTRLPHADITLPNSDFTLSEFDRLLVSDSVFGIATERFLGSFLRQHTLDSLNALSDAAEIKSPKFVFAHIVCPHAPFVFSRDGSTPRNTGGGPRQRAKLYGDQVYYLDKLVERTVDSILARSKRPPIIIIQGDHGEFDPKFSARWALPSATKMGDAELQRSFKSRVCILNAYYFPDGKSKLLYDGITPVNTFRIVLNAYFGGHYPLLDDRTYIPRTGCWAADAGLLKMRPTKAPMDTTPHKWQK